MGLLAYGDTGWGDELFFATLMTIAVAAAATAIVIRVAKKSSSPQPVSPKAKSPIYFKAIV